MREKRDILFIHPDFPGQFRRLAPAFAKMAGLRVFGVGDREMMEWLDLSPGRVVGYEPPAAVATRERLNLRGLEMAVRRGRSMALLAESLIRDGLEPAVIFVHPGWGDSFFLKDLFPNALVVGLFEFYYHAQGVDVGFDPEFPSSGIEDAFRLRVRNLCSLQALDSCDYGVTPTNWQKSLFPERYQSGLEVIHEGIDTDRVKPHRASLTLADGRVLTADSEVMTYVSRNLDPYRGFHCMVRSLPRILRERPNCQVLIVGANGDGYGAASTDGRSYRDRYLDEVRGEIDMSRVHLLGMLPYEQYLDLLAISSVHLYLTYPFVLSWSMLEAMSTGCIVVGSSTPPVEEVIEHGKNGLLVDFFDYDQIAATVIDVLARPERYRKMAQLARQSVVAAYDFKTVSLPAYRSIVERAA